MSIQETNSVETNTETIDPPAGELIAISLAYAPTPELQLYKEITIKKGSTILDALKQVGWLDAYPELLERCNEHQQETKVDNKSWRVGVYSQKKPLSYQLVAFDRIEIYRPLTIDPMRKRKRRAIK